MGPVRSENMLSASVFLDMRVGRLARHLATRSNKKDMHARNLPFLRLALRDKSKCVLFATFPKSGWNWSADVLDYALFRHFRGSYDIAYGGEGDLKHREQKLSLFVPADARARNQALVREQIPALDIDLCLHTHGFWRESPLWGLDRANTIVVARNIPSTLFSYYRSRRTECSFDDVIADGVLDRVVRFYNSWAAFSRRPGARLEVFHYEDLRREPLKGFQVMARSVFGVSLPEPVMQEAVAYFSFDKQKQREWQFAADEKQHFHFRGALDYTDMINAPARARIAETLAARLDPLFAGLAHPPSR
ncbi:MAG: sulfotransferase domain-containing protein [Xanthobacteraceae bacterium]|nr:sulfotransferase domain-containing protein [Xanthobacteraceae bacterium]